MIIGGVAASVLGRPRLTLDIDALALLAESDWARMIDAAARHGIVPRIEDPLDFAHRTRVLLMTHAASGINMDITFSGLSFEQTAIEMSEVHDVGGLRVHLPRIEDLLIMKAVAGRPKDLQDIEGLLAAHPDAKIDVARRLIREFATAMSMPDILAEFEKVVARSK